MVNGEWSMINGEMVNSECSNDAALFRQARRADILVKIMLDKRYSPIGAVFCWKGSPSIGW